MGKEKVLSVVGARPNYVKLVAVYEVFSKFFDHVVIDTGQHYDYEMNKIFFDQLSIPEPDYYLGVGSGSHGYQVGEIIKRAEEILLKERPEMVVVYGDTNSTLGGALAATKAGFRVSHVEAGLRSYDMSMPEEINRRITDHVSHILFAPTRSASNNLSKESVLGRVYLVGDVHVDILKRWVSIAETRSTILERLAVEHQEYVVVTFHRAENVDNANRLRRIMQLINEVSHYLPVVFPIHPRTRKRLEEFGMIKKLGGRVVLTEPLGYMDFIKLLKHSNKVITDSGGVQREAYILEKPVVVIRRTTEWVELIEKGQALLLNPDDQINTEKIMEWRPKQYVSGLLGDGKASIRIAEILLRSINSIS